MLIEGRPAEFTHSTPTEPLPNHETIINYEPIFFRPRGGPVPGRLHAPRAAAARPFGGGSRRARAGHEAVADRGPAGLPDPARPAGVRRGAGPRATAGCIPNGPL